MKSKLVPADSGNFPLIRVNQDSYGLNRCVPLIKMMHDEQVFRKASRC